ncbi:MAG: tetratricopeptide repeat protein [Thermodesulfovibrionales bacterium]
MSNAEKITTAQIGVGGSIICLGIVIFAVFFSSLFAEFVYDDVPGILQNNNISLKNIPMYFTTGLWDLLDVGVKDEFLYRPLSPTYSALIHAIGGKNPFIYHLANILLHLGNSILVFFLIRKLFTDMHKTLYPLLGALVFAVHPVHVESVAWIGGSVDLLGTLFFLFSFLFYVIMDDRHAPGYLILSALFFVFSLLSKEVALVLPAVLVVYDYVYSRKIYFNRLLLFSLISILYLIVRSIVLGKTLGVLHFSTGGIIYVLQFIAGFIKLLFFPWPIGVYREPPHFGLGVVVFSTAALIFMLYLAGKNRLFVVPFFWLVATLAPPLLLAFYSTPTFAVRFLYLPSVGFVAILTAFLWRFSGKHQMAARLVLLTLCAIFGFLSVAESGRWRNDAEFYSKMISENPEFAGGYVGLATYYERKGFYERAISEYENALRHARDDNQKASAYDSLGYLYGIKGSTDKSIINYQKELLLKPGSSNALVGIGNNYMMKNDLMTALEYYEKAFSSDRKNFEACYNLAMLNERTGRRDKAAHYYALFLEIAPESKYRETLGIVRKKLNDLTR